MPDTGSVFASEGTAAHDVAETCLREGRDASELIGATIAVKRDDGTVDEFVVDQEMADYVQQFIDYVRDIDADIAMFEQRVDYSEYVPEGFGTADVIAVKRNTLHVVDLKYGKGVRVDADENVQGMCYGLGALLEYQLMYDIDTVVITIHQPRLDHVTTMTISADELLLWAETDLYVAARRTQTHADELVPGAKQCQFCKAKGKCRALMARSTEIAVAGFSEVDSPIKTPAVDVDGPTELENAEIAALLPKLDLISGWVKAVQAHAQTLLEAGQSVPGYKLVAGRGSRDWTDSEAAERALKRKLGAADAFKKELISVAQAEKKLGKGDAILKKYVVKTPGKPTIAEESDKREAIVIDVTDGFEATAVAAE